MKYLFLILLFFWSKNSYSQDTISLSQIRFQLNSCEIDSNLQNFDFLAQINKNQTYKIIYQEYVISSSSAYYADCRSKTLQNFLNTKYNLKIIKREANTMIRNNKNRKKEVKKLPVSKEIYLIKMNNK